MEYSLDRIMRPYPICSYLSLKLLSIYIFKSNYTGIKIFCFLISNYYHTAFSMTIEKSYFDFSRNHLACNATQQMMIQLNPNPIILWQQM